MSLVPSLTKSQKERHHELIRRYCADAFGTCENTSIELIGNGREKGVYEVNRPNQTLVATAASKNPEDRLLEEYNVLTELYEAVPNRFPRPFGHYRPEAAETLGDLLVMERLQHEDLNKFKRNNSASSGFRRELSHTLGYAITEVIEESNRYMSDPHDGNIMVQDNEDSINLKFCDAIQFLSGSYETGIYSLLDRSERPESYRFIKDFRDGARKYFMEEQDLDSYEANQRTAFMEDINPIF